jgi:hypothetical protein
VEKLSGFQGAEVPGRGRAGKPTGAASKGAKKPAKQPKKAGEEAELQDYMDAMDEELSNAGLHSDFLRQPAAPSTRNQSASAAGKPENATSSAPVHVEANLLSNILRSVDAEATEGAGGSGWQQHAGPATAMLASMGLRVPANADRDDKKQ